MSQPIGRLPGVYLNLSMQEYHDDPAIGGTAINAILKSDEKYWEQSIENSDREQLDTKAFKMGRAYHSMVLEPEKPFPFEIKPKVQSTKMEGFIGEGDYNDLLKMYHRLLMNPLHWNCLHGGYAEASIFYRDPGTGLMCKIRPDNFSCDYVGDLKTAKSVDEKDMFFDFPRNKYQLSGYRYSVGMQILKQMIRDGYQMPPEFDSEFVNNFINNEKQLFAFIFQDKKPPFETLGWVMTPYVAELGHFYYRSGLNKINDFYHNPEYVGKKRPISNPGLINIMEGMIYVQKNF